MEILLENKLKKIEKESVCKERTLTRSIYLRSLALIYLFAFLSLFFQIQGLWGDEGILPAGTLLKKLSENFKEKANFKNFPTLLWFSEDINREFMRIINLIGLGNIFTNISSAHIDNSLYVLCIIGIFISLSIVLNRDYAFNMFGFFMMWLIYLNFFIIGQVFMSYQWDTFLLEAGFISIFLAPIYKDRLIILTPIDNLAFNLLKFLLFRFMYSSGIVKVTSGCKYWSSFTALHYHFQSQPLPNVISYYAHFLPDGVKKMLVAEHFMIEIYLPFLYFLFHRRFSLFAGIMNYLLQIVIIMTGNYNFFNLLTIAVNLTLLDDEILRSFLPEWIIRVCDLDPLADLKIYLKKKGNKFKNLFEEKNENLENSNQNAFNAESKPKESPEEKIRRILQDKNLRNIHALEADDTTFPNNLFAQNSLMLEALVFQNIFAISGVITFFLLYPIKDLLSGNLKLKVEDIKPVYNKTFLNYYMIFIFVYISIIFTKDLISSFSSGIIVDEEEIQEQLKTIEKSQEEILNKKSNDGKLIEEKLNNEKLIDEKPSDETEKVENSDNKENTDSTSNPNPTPNPEPQKISLPKLKKSQSTITKNIIYFFSSTFNLMKYFIFYLFFCLLFLECVSVFFTSIDLNLVKRDKNNLADQKTILGKGVSIAEFIFKRYRSVHGYGLFRKMTGVTGRPELEILITKDNHKWENLNFMYKMSDSENFRMKFNIPHQPRVDWQMWFAALSKDMNSEPWLVIMLGKVLEKNPVVLDLLGYHVDEREFYYKSNKNNLNFYFRFIN
jgi:hypothetical protein